MRRWSAILAACFVLCAVAQASAWPGPLLTCAKTYSEAASQLNDGWKIRGMLFAGGHYDRVKLNTTEWQECRCSRVTEQCDCCNVDIEKTCATVDHIHATTNNRVNIGLCKRVKN